MLFKILSLAAGLFYLYWFCINAIKALIDGCSISAILVWAGIIWVCANSIISDITHMKD